MLRRFLHKPQAQWSTRDQVAAELVRVAERIPHEELQDADARAALIDAIRAGQVIGVYTARFYGRHNIELAHVGRDVDPRISAVQWTAYWRAGRTGASVIEQHSAAQRVAQLQAQLAATPGQIPQFDELCRARLDEMEQKSELTPRVVAHLRAEMARATPHITAYAYRAPGFGACVWDDAMSRHFTAAEYDGYVAALASAVEELPNA